MAGTHAQTAKDSIGTTIQQLFDAMRNSDSTALKACFGDSALLQTITRGKKGELVVVNETVGSFAKSIASLGKGDGDERHTMGTILVDGPMATAWVPYQFYYKGKFSHCGVNNFTLIRFNGVWKVQYIIDTRRRTGCIE